MIGNDLDAAHVVLVEGFLTLDVHAAIDFFAEHDRHGEFGRDVDRFRRRHVARIPADVVHHLRGALGDRRADDSVRDRHAIRVVEHLRVGASVRAEHEKFTLVLLFDQRDDDVRVAQYRMDDVGGRRHQFFRFEFRGYEPRHLCNERHTFAATLLAFVAHRVLDGDGRMACEELQHRHVARFETPRRLRTDAERADELTAAAEDGYADHGIVGQFRQAHALHVAVAVVHDGLARLHDAPHQAAAGGELGIQLDLRQAMDRLDPDDFPGRLVQADRTVVGAQQFAGMSRDAGQQGTQRELVRDVLEDAAERFQRIAGAHLAALGNVHHRGLTGGTSWQAFGRTRGIVKHGRKATDPAAVRALRRVGRCT